MNIAVRAGNLEVLQSLVGKVSLVTGSISTIGRALRAPWWPLAPRLSSTVSESRRK
jgi:hypothetical protein